MKIIIIVMPRMKFFMRTLVSKFKFLKEFYDASGRGDPIIILKSYIINNRLFHHAINDRK